MGSTAMVQTPLDSCRTREQRRHCRHKTTDLRAIITDGRITYNGLVQDISESGLCVRDIPPAYSASRSLLSIVVQHGALQHKLVARLCWQRQQSNSGKTMGMEIAVIPENWLQFVVSW